VGGGDGTREKIGERRGMCERDKERGLLEKRRGSEESQKRWREKEEERQQGVKYVNRRNEGG